MKRDSLEIIYSILKHTKKPINRTKLMTKANIGWTRLTKHYTPVLLEGGFIEKGHPSTAMTTSYKKSAYLYVCTTKGRELMEKIASIYHDLGWDDKLNGGS